MYKFSRLSEYTEYIIFLQYWEYSTIFYRIENRVSIDLRIQFYDYTLHRASITIYICQIEEKYVGAHTPRLIFQIYVNERWKIAFSLTF